MLLAPIWSWGVLEFVLRIWISKFIWVWKMHWYTVFMYLECLFCTEVPRACEFFTSARKLAELSVFATIPVYTVVVFRSLVVDSWRFASLLKYYAFLVLLSSRVKPNSPIARYICLFVYYLPYNSPFYIIWCMAHFVHVGHDVFDCCPSGIEYSPIEDESLCMGSNLYWHLYENGWGRKYICMWCFCTVLVRNSIHSYDGRVWIFAGWWCALSYFVYVFLYDINVL